MQSQTPEVLWQRLEDWCDVITSELLERHRVARRIRPILIESPGSIVPSIMETSLHRQLKAVYADQGARLEAPLGNYRIDVVCDGELIEIQHGSLAAIRDKVRDLLQSHRVLVVKPIVRRKQLVKQDAKGGRIISRRLSPKRGREIDLFDEMIHFTRVFPHPNLTIEVPLVDVEEWRYPGHGRRRRRRSTDHVVEDQKLGSVRKVISRRVSSTAE